MKKAILAFAVVAVSFAACNGGDTVKETPKDTTKAVVVDTTKAVVVDTAKKAVVDTAKKMEAGKK